MTAAATAAGYLYASGRLRGRNGREGEEAPREEKTKTREEKVHVRRREPLTVAVIPERQVPAPAPRNKPAPKIQYRTRRWKPE